MGRGKRRISEPEGEADLPSWALPSGSQNAGQSSREIQRTKHAEEEEEEYEIPLDEEVKATQEELTQAYESAAADAELTSTEMSREELDKVVGEVMRYMLFRYHKEPGVPVRREDLVKLVNNTYGGRHGVAKYVITQAQARFATIFGYEMKEIERVRQSRVNKGKQVAEGLTAKLYVLRSILQPGLQRKYVETAESACKKGLGFIIMNLIRGTGEKIDKKRLWAYLNKLGICENDKNHPVFGNVQETVAHLEKQRYFQGIPVPGADDDESIAYELAENGPDENSLQHYFNVAVARTRQ